MHHTNCVWRKTNCVITQAVQFSKAFFFSLSLPAGVSGGAGGGGGGAGGAGGGGAGGHSQPTFTTLTS